MKIKSKNSLIIFVIALVFCFSCKTSKNKTAKTNLNSLSIKLENGKWFNGENFVNRTVWINNGILSFKETNKPIDTVIDISNKYVIPPFAEAHNHNLESDYKLDARINSYLSNGVFYVKMLSSIKRRIDPLMHNYNKPTGIDVSLAQAPLTAKGGHPIALRKRFLEMGRFDNMFKTLEDIETHGYFIIDNEIDLEDKWKTVLSFKPDFIKIMLLHSEEYEKRKDDKSYFGDKGLDPNLVPKIVEKAHKNGLRVSAHVETAHDFHIALESGVDEIAHLPEFDNGKRINKKDAILAKEKGVVVVTTVSLITKRKDKSNYYELVENIKQNLKLLNDEGVILAIGSDMYNDNSVGEFQMLHSLNIFSNRELLKMWCENAAITTFYNRKIGFLKEGYEASFLVLNTNPLDDISNINKEISLRVKQGEILD